jgi:SNF2 family DNA or RNA helicase
VRFVHTAKVEAVVELCEELQGEPLLLAIGFHHDVEAIRRALGQDIPCINGQTTRTQGSDFIERWNKGLLPLMMVHPASAGHGLNLQKFSARHVGFFYIPDDYDQYDQMFRRVWRQGNKADFVMRHHFVAQGTVDEPKMRNLVRKCTEQKDFLQAMKEYADRKYGLARLRK